METTQSSSQSQGTKSELGLGVLALVGAVGVFIICSIVQGLGHSNMFSTSYPQPDSMVLDALMNVTFYPGWAMIALLVVSAFKAFTAK